MKNRVIAFLLLIAALLPMVVAAAPATTLEVVWMAWPKDMVDKLIAGFEKQNPGIKVDVQLVPFTQLFQTLEVRLPAGGTPDVYLADGPLTPSYAARGFLLPLDQYYAG